MTDLPQLLERAAGATPEPRTLTATVEADLRRGRRALLRTRRRRSAAGLAGVAAAGVVGAGLARLAPQQHPATVAHQKRTTTTHEKTNAVDAVALLDQPLQAGPYSFATTPDGWVVQGVRPQAVTLIPPGAAPDSGPDVFVGKLVIMLDGNPPSGQQVVLDGRTYWVRGDSGYTTIETHTRPGEPDGMVSVQFPDDTGWSRALMLQFLSSVQVGPGAQPGLG